MPIKVYELMPLGLIKYGKSSQSKRCMLCYIVFTACRIMQPLFKVNTAQLLSYKLPYWCSILRPVEQLIILC